MEEQDMMHYLNILIILSNRWGEKKHPYESCARLMARSIWSVWCFQENISRSKRNQSCSDRGGGMCGWTEEFLQKGMASFHNAVPVGGDVERLSVSNSPLLICVQTLSLNYSFFSCCHTNVKLEEAVRVVTSMLLCGCVQGWESYKRSETTTKTFVLQQSSSVQGSTKIVKILLWNQPHIKTFTEKSLKI